jgi:hypothetical protein
MLIRGGKPVFLAVNKVEGEAMAAAAENFRQAGASQGFRSARAWAGDWRPAGRDLRKLPAPAAGAPESGGRSLRPEQFRTLKTK